MTGVIAREWIAHNSGTRGAKIMEGLLSAFVSMGGRFDQSGQPIDLARQPLGVSTITAIINRASVLFTMEAEYIKGRRRIMRAVRARAAVTMAARQAGYSFAQIGNKLGGRDHSTIRHAWLQAKVFYERDARFRAKCDALLAMLPKEAAEC